MSNPPCVADIVQPLAVDDWVSEPGRHQDTSRRQARRYLLAEPSHRYDGVNGSTLRRRPRPLNLRFLSGVLRTRIDGQSSHPQPHFVLPPNLYGDPPVGGTFWFPPPASQGARPVRVTPAPPARAALKRTSCHERPNAPARRRRTQAHAGPGICLTEASQKTVMNRGSSPSQRSNCARLSMHRYSRRNVEPGLV